MSVRRLLIVMAIIAALVGGGVAASKPVTTTPLRFGNVPFVSRPYVSHLTPITTTWYCPGVPAAGDGMGGEVVIANPADTDLRGRITLIAGTEPPVSTDVTAPARDVYRFDVDAVVTAPFVAAVIELEGGEGIVEQRAFHPAGDAVTSCTTQTSSSWYFADGSTLDGTAEQLIITNPSVDTVNVNLAFFTKSGKREPAAFQGDSIEPQSVKIIDVAANRLVDEAIIGVQVVATRGRLLVARAQHYVGGGRLGYSLNLGAPEPSEQLWFAEGEKGAGITEQYVLFNPTDEDASVVASVLGVPLSAAWNNPEPIDVGAGEVVTFDMSSITGLPDGPHSMVFATLASPSIVVERVLSKPVGDSGVATTVVMGMTPEYVVGRWYVPIGVDEAVQGALVVYNADGVDAVVTVNAIGPGGEVAVPGLEAIDVPQGAIRTIDLTDPSVFGRTVVVTATQRVFVERRLPRGGELGGRSGSWAMPECGPCTFSSPSS